MKNRMIRLMLASLLVAVLPLAGCVSIGPIGAVTPSGKPAIQTYDITGFDSVDVGSAFQVEIEHFDTFRVAVTADDNLFGNIVVEKVNGTLRISTKSVSILGRPTLQASISIPDLHGLTLSGAANCTLTDVTSAGDVSLNLSGASAVGGKLTTTGKISVISSGAAQCVFKGSASGDGSIDCSGASFLDLSGFTMKNAKVTLSGASRATVNASDKLDIDLSGGSRLRYLGTPNINIVNVSGGSTVEKG